MKKIFGFSVFLFLAVVFFSCKNAINDEVYVITDKIEAAESLHISGEILNYSKYELSSSMNEFASNARTIMPPDLTVSTNYTYFLYGEQIDVAKTFLVYKKLDIVNGKFSIDIDAADWTLTLFALEAGAATPTFAQLPPSDIRRRALLKGTSAAFLSKLGTDGDVTIQFTLSSDGLLGDGYVNLKVMLSSDCGVSNWYTKYSSFSNISTRVEIQNRLSGEPITYAGSDSHALTFNPATAMANFGGEGINATTHVNYGIAPGTYLFAVKFYDNASLIGLWYDILEVRSGRICDGIVYVPDFLNELPAAPATFTATYVEDSEDSAGHNDYYKVHFQWENTPSNEQYYEIQVAACPKSMNLTGSELTDAIWAAAGAENRLTLNRSLMTKDYYVDGSVFANATDATVYLKLGERYLARIRSVNEMGESDWTQVTIPDGTTATVSGYTGGTLAYFKNSAGTVARTINRGRLTYNLNGGTYYRASTVATNSHEPVYFTHEGLNASANVGVEYWNGEGWNASSTDDDLRKVEKDMYGLTKKYVFSGWSTSFNNLSSHESSPYKNFENQTVYADFEEDTSGSGPDLQYKLLANWISYSLNGSTKTAISESDTAKKAVLVISKASNTFAGNISLGFSVAVPDGSVPGDFSRFTLNVFDEDNIPVASEERLASGNSAMFNSLNLASWEKGIYTFIFTAILSDAFVSAPYSVSLTLDLRS